MNVDERARQAARRLHEQAAGLDTNALLARVEVSGSRSRWLVPGLVTAVVVAVVAVSALAVSQLVQRGPDSPIINEPDPLPSLEPPIDESPSDTEPTPDSGPGGAASTGWWRVPQGEVFGTAGVDERITGIANKGGTTVAVGTVGEQLGVWVRDPQRVAEDTDAWQRIDPSELCGDASCSLTDITVTLGGFVAVGSLDGQAMAWISEDGLDWQRSTIGSDGEQPVGPRELEAVTYRGGRAVAVGTEYGGPIRSFAAVSSDGGATWETLDIGYDSEVDVFVSDVVAAPFGFVAVGGGGDVLNFWRSETGHDWVGAGPRNVNESGPSIGGLATLGDDVIFLSSVDGDAAAWRSPDGETWERLGGNLPAEGDQRMEAAAYAGGGFVAVGSDGLRPAAWVLEGDSWRQLEGGDAFEEPGTILAAVERDGHSLIAAGVLHTSEWEEKDAAVWTYATPEGPSENAGSCSAAELEQPIGQNGLPDVVAATRDEIARAALACDLDALGEIASRDERSFAYSFGGGDDPVGFWRRLEEEGHQPPGPTWWMVRVLDLPYATVETQFRADEYETVYVWPSAFAVEDPDSEDWRLLVEEGLYTEEELEQFREFGGYIGYRVGITEDGEWVFFVAGD